MIFHFFKIDFLSNRQDLTFSRFIIKRDGVIRKDKKKKFLFLKDLYIITFKTDFRAVRISKKTFFILKNMASNPSKIYTKKEHLSFFIIHKITT